jgi:glycosyltransferase involved in cell wall biosynthesis
VVIPVLNEEAGLRRLIEALVPALEATAMNWSILFVDDGSTDGTLAAIRSLRAKDARVTAVSLSRNFGKEIAIAAGLRYAGGDAVVLMDADLQHPPSVIVEFVARWRDGSDVVLGQRSDSRALGVVRRFWSRAFHMVFRAIARTQVAVGASDFVLLDRKAVDALNRLGERTRFTKGFYGWIGFRSTVVPFHCDIRAAGDSRWRFVRLMQFALDGLFSFSNVPLKIWSYAGIVVSLLAFAYALWFFMRTLIYGVDVPGFPSLIVSVMFFAGVQLISLGVIGEYLARIYEEVKARPLFLVAEEIGVDDPAKVGARTEGGSDR